MDSKNLASCDVVISGIGVKVPGAENFEELKFKLLNELAFTGKYTETAPEGIQDFPQKNGRITKNFEAEADNFFFGMSSTYTQIVTKEGLLVLETAYEALMDAGLHPQEASEMLTGVFSSSSTYSTDLMPYTTKGRLAVLATTKTMTANRISFLLNTTGTSVSINGWDAGGMANLQLANMEIQSGRADMVIVSSFNVFVEHIQTVHQQNMGWISDDGRTCSFDDNATGHSRSEGSVTLILQRSNLAKRAYAKVRLIHTTHLLNNCEIFPTKENWATMLKNAYQNTDISPDDIDYLEADGSAIREYDSAELNGVDEVFKRKKNNPLLIGSVKSNVGHTEGCSSDLAIVKAIVVLESGEIPGNLNFSSPNNDVPALLTGAMQVAQSRSNLPRRGLVAVNGFSVTGTYGHCILEKYAREKVPSIPDIPRLVLLASRTSQSVAEAVSLVTKQDYDPDYYSLLDEVFPRSFGRYLGCGYVILPKTGEEPPPSETAEKATERPLWLVCSGMGCQWTGMGKFLMRLPLTAQSIQRSHDTLKRFGIDLIDIISTEDESVFDNILHCFVGITSIQVALIDLIKVLKLEYEGIIGHSAGEMACAYADGCLTAEETVIAAYMRGRASNEVNTIDGLMAAVGHGYNDIKDQVPPGIEVACHNSDKSCTLSGPKELVEKYVEELKRQKVFAKAVNVSNIPYHSSYIQQLGPVLFKYLNQVLPVPKQRSSKWISSSAPEEKWDTEDAKFCGPQYLVNNLLSPVLFEEACRHIPDNAVVVEVAPHGLLQAILKRAMPNSIQIPLTSKTAPDGLIFLLKAIGKLYLNGFYVNVGGLYPKTKWPVSRGTPSTASLMSWCRNTFNQEFPTVKRIEYNSKKLLDNLNMPANNHIIGGEKYPPLAMPIATACTMYSDSKKIKIGVDDIVFQMSNIRFGKLTSIDIEGNTEIHCNLFKGSSDFALFNEGEETIRFSCNIVSTKEPITLEHCDMGPTIYTQSKEEIYATLERRGYKFDPRYKLIKSVAVTARGKKALIDATNCPFTKIELLMQLYLFSLPQLYGNELHVPAFVEQITINCVSLTNDVTEFELCYDEILDELYGPNISIKKIMCQKVGNHCDLSVLTTAVMPYENPDVKNIDEFFNFCMNIMALSNTGKDVYVLDINGNQSSELVSIIKRKFKNCKVDQKSPRNVSGPVAPVQLVLCSALDLNHITQGIAEYVIAFGEISNGCEIPKSLSVVTSFCGKPYPVSMLTKKETLKQAVPHIIMPDTEHELVSMLKQQSLSCTSLFVVSKRYPANGFMNLRMRVQKKVRAAIRWMFILDVDAPEFSSCNNFYKEQIEKGLVINVLKDGAWNFFHELPLYDVKEDIFSMLPTEGQAKDLPRFEFFGTSDKEECLVDFSGKIGERNIMGILSLDEQSVFLSWPKPSSWTAEQAASVPVAYALAYYCFYIFHQVESFETVLVTDGCSVRGQAAIAVALPLAEKVYATVASEEEKVFLRSIFPQIKAEHIFDHTQTDIASRIAFLGETLPKILYNTFDGPHFYQLYKSMGKWCRIYQMGREFVGEHSQFGMGGMIVGMSLYLTGVSALNRITNDMKRQILGYVTDGIKKGVVRPPIMACNDGKVVYSETRHFIKSAVKSVKFSIKSTSSYLVIGDGSQADKDLINWLVTRGARKISFYRPSQQNQIELLQEMQSKHVNLRLYDDRSSGRLVQEVDSGRVYFDGIVVVSMEAMPNSETLKFIKAVINGDGHLVTITTSPNIGFSFPVSTSRISTNIIWRTNASLNSLDMDKAAQFVGEQKIVTVVSNVTSDDKRDWAGQVISYSTPPTVARLVAVEEHQINSLAFLPLPYGGSSTHSLAPTFVFPGMDEDRQLYTHRIAPNLLLPMYLAQIPQDQSIPFKLLASSAVTCMENINKINRAMNVVGMGTGCALALEVTRILEEQGHNVALVLVDSPIPALQHGFGTLEDLEIALLDRLADICCTNLDHKGYDSWRANANRLVMSSSLSWDSAQSVLKGIDTVRHRLRACYEYNMDGVHLKGPVSIIRSEENHDNYHYYQLCQSSMAYDKDMDHATLVKSDDLIEALNQFPINDHYIEKNVHDNTWAKFFKHINRKQSNTLVEA